MGFQTYKYVNALDINNPFRDKFEQSTTSNLTFETSYLNFLDDLFCMWIICAVSLLPATRRFVYEDLTAAW